MRFRKFGVSDIHASEVTIGTWAIGGANWGIVNKRDSIDAIHTMLDYGVNMIDTAPAYNFGESERIIGEAIRGRRHNLYIVTKTAVYNSKEKPFVNDGRKECVLRLCEQSLQNLSTDYIDLMIIHWPDTEHNAPIEETMEALSLLKAQGKIRHVGLSNFDQGLAMEARQFGYILALQSQYSMIERNNEKLMVWAHENDMANMTYGSLGGGILTGAIRKLPEFAPDDMRLLFYDCFREPKFTKVMELLSVLDVIANEHRATVAQVAINWNSQKKFVNTTICGIRNRKEAMDNCEGFTWQLSESEIKLIDDTLSKLFGG